MSESASDPKVEDVLSSVRRLVSGELPRKPRPKLPEGPGALVLTEAQRVEEGPRLRVASKSLEDRIAELEAAVGDSGDEFEPDGSEDQSQHRPDRIVYTRPPTEDEVAEAHRSTVRLSQIALIETGPANDEDDDGEPVQFRHESADDATDVDEAPMAEDVPHVRPTSGEVAAFSNPDDVVARLEARFTDNNTGSEETVAPEPVVEAPVDLEIDDETFEQALSDAVEGIIPEDNPADETVEVEEETSDLDIRDASETAGQTDAVIAAPDADTSDDRASDMDELTAADFEDDDGRFEPESHDELGVTEALDLSAESVEAPLPSEDTQDEVLVLETKADTADAAEPDTSTQGMDSASDELSEEEPGIAGDVPDEVQPEQSEPTDDGFDIEEEVLETASAAIASAALEKLADEDATRLMVARLIREELQGELGERITRNVRKLVRREIMRALSARDLS